jgi:hypothetical protein
MRQIQVGGVAEAMQVPFRLVESCARGDLLASLVHEPEVDVALRGREGERLWTLRNAIVNNNFCFIWLRQPDL